MKTSVGPYTGASLPTVALAAWSCAITIVVGVFDRVFEESWPEILGLVLFTVVLGFTVGYLGTAKRNRLSGFLLLLAILISFFMGLPLAGSLEGSALHQSLFAAASFVIWFGAMVCAYEVSKRLAQ